MGRKLIDLTGKRFGRLEVLGFSHDDIDGNVSWDCICDCDTIVTVQGHDLRFGNTKSCGCLRKELLAKRVGELNPSWNPSLTDEDRQATRNYPKYDEWRKAVYARDDYTCQKCGKKGETLNAHHIENYATNKELRTSVDNGKTLCATCHKDFHHVYGHKNNTRQQFDEWVEGEERACGSHHS